MRHVRTARALAPYLLPMPIVTVLTVLGAGLVSWLGFFGSSGQLPIRLRAAGMLLAIALGWLAEDSAGVTVAGSPTTLAMRRAFRAAIPVGVATSTWVAACAVAQHRDPGLAALPATVEVVTLAAVAIATTSVQARREPGERVGHLGPVVLVCFLFSLHFLPDRLSLVPDATSGAIDAVHLRWLAVAAVATVLILATVRDAASRRR
jgi:hypothetical protein